VIPTINKNSIEWPYWESIADDPQEIFPQAQRVAVAKLAAEIMIRHDIPPENLIRHLDNGIKYVKHPTPGLHTDPSAHFGWDEWKSSVLSAVDQYEEQTEAPVVS